ncbi:prepilin peptidase [Enterococcus faecalis]
MNDLLQNIPHLVIYGYVFIIGICLGSFFLVVGYRLPKRESLLKNSHCESCQHPLSALQLIPLVSYLIARGKCKYCQEKISISTLIFELLCGCLFAFSTWLFWGQREMLIAWSLTALLLIISATDFLYQLIPNKIVGPFFVGGIFLRLLIPQNDLWWYPLAGFFAGFLPLFLLGAASKKGMGGGDIKLFAVLGVYIGPIQVLITLFVASLIALLFYIARFIFSGKMQKFIPFGPFIAIGTGIVYFMAAGLP